MDSCGFHFGSHVVVGFGHVVVGHVVGGHVVGKVVGVVVGKVVGVVVGNVVSTFFSIFKKYNIKN